MAKGQKILDRTYIRLSSEQRMSKQSFQFRSENQTAVRQHCIMKRLYPQPVAHQPERLGCGIEKGEGEHAIEPVHALRSPLPPSVQDDFGIAVRAEYVAFGLQLRSDRSEIINLAIEGQGKRSIVGQHRLRAAGKSDDGRSERSQVGK